VTEGGKSIEQLETDDERQLLAGEAIDERLEQRWKPGRLHSAEARSQEP